MGKFTFTQTPIEGVVVVEPAALGDSRGYFMETYNRQDFVTAGIDSVFVQDNQSLSRKGILRGLHAQKNHPQAKLVRVLSGAVFDVCVDVRPGSATFGAWYGAELSEENRRQLFVPRGLLHGFLVLSESAVLAYKCDDFYHSEDEVGLIWNDPAVGIEWPLDGIGAPVLSDKDTKWECLAGEAESPYQSAIASCPPV